MASASVVSCVAWVIRWFEVGHIPLQNLFEVFMFMGMAMYPIAWFSRRFLEARIPFVAALLGFVVLFPPGFVDAPSFSPTVRPRMPALVSPLFGPHVAVYMIAYVVMILAAAHGVAMLAMAAWRSSRDLFAKVRGRRQSDPISIQQPDDLEREYDQVVYRLIMFGFPLLTVGLLLGSVWGKLAWGDYWNWDPKEMWGLASWLIFLVYFHFRYMFAARYRKLDAMLAVLGGLAIILTLLWVNLAPLFSGKHSYA